MKYTLLEMTQNILSSMNADEVNSIGDNAESQQVALICKTVFYDMISELNLPEAYGVFHLQAFNSSAKPTLLRRPDEVYKLDWLKYNVISVANPVTNYRYLQYVPIDKFFEITHQLVPTDSNVVSFIHPVDGDNITFYCRNDIAPTYYSSFNDRIIVCDSYDSAIEASLQDSKTLGSGPKSRAFTMLDTFIPPLDDQVFALYYNECKALAWAELKETVHQKAEQTAKRQRASVQRNKDALSTKQSRYDRLPHFGR